MSKSFKEDLTGQRFGRLTVLEFVPNDRTKSSYWKCECKCGRIIVARMSDLKKGKTSSCGCIRRELIITKNTKHGAAQTRLYKIWKGMKQRCLYRKHTHYKEYGGRGITICEEWKNNFKAFYEWSIQNGYTDKLTIDRIDVDGNYEPSNCRWVDMKTQCRNKKNNTIVVYEGKEITLAEAAELSGINRKTFIRHYLKKKNFELN